MSEPAPKIPTKFENHRFHYLDALRGIAAMIVVMRHVGLVYGYGYVPPNSYLAVDFFFCLSGFVIAFSYERRLTGNFDFISFTITRYIRLAPLAILATLLGAASVLIAPLHPRSPILALLADILFGALILPSYWNKLLFPLDTAMWTLFFEIFANLVYAGLTRFGKIKANTLIIFSVITALVLTVLRKRFENMDFGYAWDNAVVGLFRVAVSFTLGILVFRAYMRVSRQPVSGRRTFWPLLLLTGCFIFLLCNNIHLFQTGVLQLITICALFPLIVYYGAQLALPQAITKTCVFLGFISYPLYILHQTLLWPLSTELAHRFQFAHPSANELVIVIYSMMMLVPAWLAGRYFDSPVRAFLTDLYRSRRNPPPASRSAEIVADKFSDVKVPQ